MSIRFAHVALLVLVASCSGGGDGDGSSTTPAGADGGVALADAGAQPDGGGPDVTPQLTLEAPAGLSLQYGQKTTLEVTAKRGEFDGYVGVELIGVPLDVKVTPNSVLVIPPDATKASFTLSTTAGAVAQTPSLK